MNQLAIANVAIRTDAAGRYCLNDLHRAAGSEKRHGPSYWLTNAQTRALIEELGPTGFPGGPLASVNDGINNGTYVAKELVYAYAMWISPAFHLKVIRAYDALATGQQPGASINLRDPKQLAVAALQLIEVNRELQAQVDTMQVTVAAHQRIAEADGSMCITDAAKVLQVRPKDLFAWLSAQQWIFRRTGGSGWIAYQHRIQTGVLEHKVTTVERSDGSEKVVEQVLVTPKGLTKLAQAMDKRSAA